MLNQIQQQTLKQSKRKYLLLLPVLFLILNASYFRWVTGAVSDALLQARYAEIVNDIDILAASLDHYVEFNDDWGTYDYSQNIRAVVEFIDSFPQTFAAAYYVAEDGYLAIFSNRSGDQVQRFMPRADAAFLAAVEEQESGRLTLTFTPEGEPAREMLLYFRWVPTNPALSGRYLVAAAVSYESINTPMAEWITWGQVISITITFLLETWLVVLVALVHAQKIAYEV